MDREPDLSAAAPQPSDGGDEAGAARGSAAMAYLLDPDSEGVVRHSFADLGFSEMQIKHGGIDDAIQELVNTTWPRVLIVDISGIEDPLSHIHRLAEISDPGTEVVVVGEQNDIVLYRGLQAAGVAEYFYKPLIGSLLNRALVAITSGAGAARPSRSGRLVFVIGVRGGVGATTVATNMAWYFAEARRRGVLLLDLDLRAGDAALQLNSKPTHALREAVDNPTRIDELFLERGVIPVSHRLSLLAGLEPLSEPPALTEDAILHLLQKILARYRYVLVDIPADMAQAFPALLHMPATILLVSDGSFAAIRDVERWRNFIGPDTPERTLLHLLNKKGADGSLPDEEMQRVIPPPDLSIKWDRHVMAASALGVEAVQKCDPIRDAMEKLGAKLSGVPVEAHRGSLWHTLFG